MVRWLATVQNWLDEGYYTAPTRKSMLNYEGWKRSRQPWESLDAWAEGIRNVRLPFSVPKFSEIMNTWAGAVGAGAQGAGHRQGGRHARQAGHRQPARAGAPALAKASSRRGRNPRVEERRSTISGEGRRVARRAVTASRTWAWLGRPRPRRQHADPRRTHRRRGAQLPRPRRAHPPRGRAPPRWLRGLLLPAREGGGLDRRAARAGPRRGRAGDRAREEHYIYADAEAPTVNLHFRADDAGHPRQYPPAGG